MNDVAVRWAEFSDYPKVRSFDEFIGDRRLDLQAGEVGVADVGDDKAVGYFRIASSSFLGWPLLSSFCVDPAFRRMGVGYSMLEWIVSRTHFTRIYTSTEVSNAVMRGLLARAGASEIGYADCLNFSGEREILYCLKGTPETGRGEGIVQNVR